MASALPVAEPAEAELVEGSVGFDTLSQRQRWFLRCLSLSKAALASTSSANAP